MGLPEFRALLFSYIGNVVDESYTIGLGQIKQSPCFQILGIESIAAVEDELLGVGQTVGLGLANICDVKDFDCSADVLERFAFILTAPVVELAVCNLNGS